MRSYNPIKKQIAQTLSAHLGVAVNAHPEHTSQAEEVLVTLANGETFDVPDIPKFCATHFLAEAEFRKIIDNPFAFLRGMSAKTLLAK